MSQTNLILRGKYAKIEACVDYRRLYVNGKGSNI